MNIRSPFKAVASLILAGAKASKPPGFTEARPCSAMIVTSRPTRMMRTLRALVFSLSAWVMERPPPGDHYGIGTK